MTTTALEPGEQPRIQDSSDESTGSDDLANLIRLAGGRAAVARALGVTALTVWRWYRGRNAPPQLVERLRALPPQETPVQRSAQGHRWLSPEAYVARLEGRRRPLFERFWEKIDIRSPDDCWNWRGGCDTGGYGIIDDGEGHTRKAHRIAMQLAGVAIGSAHVLHTCDNPICCNPRHLVLGTHHENMVDRDRKGRGKRPPSLAGQANPAARLRTEDVRSIRDRLRHGARAHDLATELGVSESSIRLIERRVTWRTVS